MLLLLGLCFQYRRYLQLQNKLITPVFVFVSCHEPPLNAAKTPFFFCRAPIQPNSNVSYLTTTAIWTILMKSSLSVWKMNRRDKDIMESRNNLMVFIVPFFQMVNKLFISIVISFDRRVFLSVLFCHIYSVGAKC